MREKTHQQTFSQAIRGMLKQGKLSINLRDSSCYYRHPNRPLKCVAGQLIPDRAYDRIAMEGRTATHGNVASVLRKHGHDPEFVEQMQSIHDNSATFRGFVKGIREFAAENDLKMPKVSK